MAETLVMGDAFNRLAQPRKNNNWCRKKDQILNEFKKFKCKIFQYNLKQAEMVKMAINLFLFNSVIMQISWIIIVDNLV